MRQRLPKSPPVENAMWNWEGLNPELVVDAVDKLDTCL